MDFKPPSPLTLGVKSEDVRPLQGPKKAKKFQDKKKLFKIGRSQYVGLG